ncbi:carboxypeptidase-like regulatory domain-containing protein [Tenacibaculum ovolyticum]|uniref:carboxypeptidase-like regulatory domain-containing protein n=1 Tax=Tenacibaculum ovolyticum TaxID=104270 RepID=UPI003BABA26A
MRQKLLFLLILFGSILKSVSQKHQKFLYGVVKDKIGVVTNAHIINLNTNKGTFTNELGEFRILVKKNDSLHISFIGYKTTSFMVKDNHFGMVQNSFILKKETYELDEVVLKKHNLLGNIALDIKQTPDDKVSYMTDKILDGIKDINMSKVNTDTDDIDRMKAPVINIKPPNFYQGVTFFNSKWLNKRKKNIPLKKTDNLEKRTQLPLEIISLLGKKTFTNEFKIPEDKIHEFIDYCSNRNLEHLFYQKKIITIITIFKEESPKFLKAIKNE